VDSYSRRTTFCEPTAVDADPEKGERTTAVDIDTVDRQFSTLQQQAQQTASLIATLAGKLSTAAAGGDPNAREWRLDLKEIAFDPR
jgi:hypothetical protein